VAEVEAVVAEEGAIVGAVEARHVTLEGVAEEAVGVAETASVVIVTTTGVDTWSGGRDGHVLFEDDWRPATSWSFVKLIQDSSDYYFRAYLKLKVYGPLKGRCVPREAVACLSFGPHRLWYGAEESRVDLGRNKAVRSLTQAKKWAEACVSLTAVQLLYRQFYAREKAQVVESFDHGWHEWFCSFDHQLHDWPDGDYRFGSRYVQKYGWITESFWPTVWDRVVRPRWELEGPL